MLTLYHLGNSRSERIIWLAEELGISYKLEKFPRDEAGGAPKAYKALHPLGRAPIIRDGDVTLIESGAIIEYILARHGGGKLAPRVESSEFPNYVQWLHMAEGTLMPHLLSMFLMQRGAEGGAPNPLASRFEQRLDQDFAYMDSHLGANPYFAGQSFTAADINMVFPVRFATDWMKRDISKHKNLAAYLDRIHARPAYKKAMNLA